MNKVKIVDSTFEHLNALGLADENAGEHPESFQWYRDKWDGDEPESSEVVVLTDSHLHEVTKRAAKKKIGLIIESPELSQVAHGTALGLRENFDTILTHNKKLIDTGDPFKFYPLGGSHIRRWGMFSKTKLVSIIVGKKQTTEGHQLRYRVARQLDAKVDLWGQPHTDWQPSKVPMLRPYYYSVVIENGREDYYFSEKLIDCMSQGTIPIYWGCPSISTMFAERGIIPFTSIKMLGDILNRISEQDYQNRIAATMTNLAIAHQFRCAEDWIVGRYPEMFDSDSVE